MKKKSIKILAIILFVVGLGVLVYPYVIQFIYQNSTASLKENYFSEIQNDKEKYLLYDKLYKKLKEENKKLFSNGQKDLVDPFSYSQPSVQLSEYGLKDNVIGFIKIDKMDIELPIYLGANNENMAKGAAHLTQTSYPIGGNNTNCVIAAHRGEKLVMFREIEKLEIGDKVIIKNFRETLVYKVAEIKIISPVDIDDILIQPDRDLVTLITCHPYRHNYQRYVVYCERTEE